MVARRADTERLHLFGIRHHGPGSARGVLTALETVDPAIVLIEGPPDADEMIRFAASPAMVPPVALLVHAEADPANSSFYPFAIFSPEWQAMRWALAKGRPVRFIDLPMTNQLAERARIESEQKAAEALAIDPPSAAADTDGSADESTIRASTPGPTTLEADQDADVLRIRRDPLAYLAEIAGYDDSEAWWNALVEQGAHGPELFVAIETAIAALRAHIDPLAPWPPDEALRERRREAHMRLAIAAASGETEGPVAVVCGAWHVPALRAKTPAKDDRALLKGLPKIKVTATWVPWTETRLAARSGYGAGVVSPGWYAHVWDELARAGTGATTFATRWQTRVAMLLRKHGRPASTASVIEATRLALSLASLRDQALPGLEEMREATLATLCDGQSAPFRLIEAELVIGLRVGEIDEAVPQMPLAADLARQQKKLKLKPEALDSEVSLDLRSEAGLAKSLLFHRLLLINLPWGTLQGTGSSRGTFRENWRLRWEPEFSVRLAEALVYGTTVEQAAGNAAIATAERATTLAAISEVVRGCLHAGLEQAANATIARLQRQAAASSDVAELAGAVPPLATILRYGTAREMPTASLRLLVTSLVEAVSAGLTYACRTLDAEAAGAMRDRVAALDVAMGLIGDDALTEAWRRALRHLAADAGAHPVLKGLAVRALYDQSVIDTGETALALSRALSPSVTPRDAGDWLDGFLGKSGQILMHDDALRALIDRWLVALGPEEFTAILPMLRRAFSSLDKIERRRMLDTIVKTAVGSPAASAGAPLDGRAQTADAPGFAEALPLLLKILGGCAEPANAGGDL